MIKMIYENQKTINGLEDISEKQFARFYSSSFLSGDVAKVKTIEFSEQECEFIAEAVSIFGGYKNYDALIEGSTCTMNFWGSKGFSMLLRYSSTIF